MPVTQPKRMLMLQMLRRNRRLKQRRKRLLMPRVQMLRKSLQVLQLTTNLQLESQELRTRHKHDLVLKRLENE